MIQVILEKLYNMFSKPWPGLEQFLEDCFPLGSEFNFVQIGANDGISFDRLFHFVTARNGRGLVVEPLPDLFEKLVENYKDYPKIIPVNIAVHATKKNAYLYRVHPQKLPNMPSWASGIASLYREHHMKSHTPSESIIQVEVDCVTLKELFEQYGVNELDLIQIDVEGYDHEVVRMIDFCSIRPKIIKYEHANLTPQQRRVTERLLVKSDYFLFNEISDTIAVISALCRKRKI
jgi:FkbM family methyltransferase